MSDKKLLYRDQVIARLGEEAPFGATPGEAPAQVIDPEGLTISETAAAEIRRQRLSRSTPQSAIRIGIRGGGCTGFSYVFDWEDGAPRDTDLVFSQHGVTVVVDPKSFVYLKGTELDFVTSMMGHGFKFNNPNAKGACGCGASVQF
ncbi:MAG TPA: iron-sulfur cluster assembly accessory protein [Kofleriaceae bacterium]|jgi:iron-sulfur cluster assembly protein|nr:iron-sulfur cluster assembly accessory protein [Kofleriaceae bacterium]